MLYILLTRLYLCYGRLYIKAVAFLIILTDPGHLAAVQNVCVRKCMKSSMYICRFVTAQ